MRGDRLMRIVLLLQSRGRMSTRELADELEVTTRTVSRDLEAIGQSGIPIVAHRGRFGGWSLMEGYRSGLTGMTPDEAAALLLRASSGPLRDVGLGGHYEAALQKLRAAYPEPERQGADFLRRRLLIDESSWHTRAAATPEALAVCQEAVWEERLLAFDYAKDEARASKDQSRLVEPLGLVVKRGVWYLAAKDGAPIKTFRVSNMLNIRLSEKSFAYPEQFDLAAYWQDSLRTFPDRLPHYEVSCIMTAEVLQAFREERYVRVLRADPIVDGQYEVAADLATPEFALRLVLGFGASVRVIQPLAFVEAVAAEAEKVREMYRIPPDS